MFFRKRKLIVTGNMAKQEIYAKDKIFKANALTISTLRRLSE